jgi:hypothetical protein
MRNEETRNRKGRMEERKRKRMSEEDGAIT